MRSLPPGPTSARAPVPPVSRTVTRISPSGLRSEPPPAWASAGFSDAAYLTGPSSTGRTHDRHTRTAAHHRTHDGTALRGGAAPDGGARGHGRGGSSERLPAGVG